MKAISVRGPEVRTIIPFQIRRNIGTLLDFFEND